MISSSSTTRMVWRPNHLAPDPRRFRALTPYPVSSLPSPSPLPLPLPLISPPAAASA